MKIRENTVWQWNEKLSECELHHCYLFSCWLLPIMMVSHFLLHIHFNYDFSYNKTPIFPTHKYQTVLAVVSLVNTWLMTNIYNANWFVLSLPDEPASSNPTCSVQSLSSINRIPEELWIKLYHSGINIRYNILLPSQFSSQYYSLRNSTLPYQSLVAECSPTHGPVVGRSE